MYVIIFKRFWLPGAGRMGEMGKWEVLVKEYKVVVM